MRTKLIDLVKSLCSSNFLINIVFLLSCPIGWTMQFDFKFIFENYRYELLLNCLLVFIDQCSVALCTAPRRRYAR